MVGSARMQVDGTAGDVAHGSTSSWLGKDHLRLLPPSANWYCSKICDWGRSDVFGLLFAFGAKNSVFIYQVTSGEDAGVKLSFFAQLVRGKRDRRVTAVQFLTDTTGDLRLVCGGEDASVQIWDVASLMMIEQHRKHKAEVMAVTVSATLDANFVVAGDRQGRISAWERDAGKVSVFMPISGDGIHSMAISPHDKALVAVGYRSGVLCLVDSARGTVRHRLDGHEQEVQCVAWKATYSTFETGQEEGDATESDISDRKVWLASSSRDKTIKVWKITSTEDPALDQVLRLPTGKQGMSFTQTKQLWLPVAWILNDKETREAAGKHSLWSGSFDGSLFRWEWNVAKAEAPEKKGKNRRASCKPVVVKGGHSRMLFSIALVPSAAEGDVVSMLTVSLDRELRLWKDNGPTKNLAAATCLETLTGLGGHAYSVSYNAATGLVAAGVGDQTIRLWNLGTDAASVASDYQCDLLWKGLQSKVTCVRWHPFQHSVLAYGMEDGRIGVYDIQSKKYNHFRTSHGSEAQQLQWIIVKPKKTGEVDDGDNSFFGSIKQLEAAQAGGQSLEEALIAQEGQIGKNNGGDDVKVLLWSCDASGHLLESNADAVDQKSREIIDNCVAFEWDEQSLRIVAKEGALTPTWLSYAPMAGMDVWREMTNLYAHQLDAQGDKKAAAFHFLSIGKIRSAVACLVSGDVYKEALALIRSRLGPKDPLLHDTLWKYSDFLAKRGRHGEAALALLNIGSVKAKTRAIHTLVNTGDILCIKAALDVLLALVRCRGEAADTDHKDNSEELAFPASFFFSIAENALSKSRFDVAETAGQLLQSRLVRSSTASHRLTWCLLSILKAVDEHQMIHCKLDEVKDEAVINQVDSLLLSDAPPSVLEFFQFLTSVRDTGEDASHLYDCVVGTSILGSLQEGKICKRWMASRADRFWFQVLSACQGCGYWFDADGEARIQEAQDLLVEANCFSDIEKAVAASTGSAITLSLRVAQKVLRFVIDVMSTSFIGALEHMREAFQLLTSKEIDGTNTTDSTLEGASVVDLRVDVMTLLYPCGFASPNDLPQCGELAEEQLDTLVLWSSVLLSQCRIALICIAQLCTEDSEQKLASMIRSMLHLLEASFLDVNRGLVDAGNKSLAEELMDEVLVAIHLLPDEPATQDESAEGCGDEKAEGTSDGLSSKQALIIDANDMRSRLTWSEDE
ncbi:hypothetical protein PC128_g9086 [Phytophthora cactorum]|nr:hypothetical protein PC128_g9086 [Phytophthora cactorum]